MVKPLLIAGLMTISAVFAVQLTPTNMMADQWAGKSLESMIPVNIDGWAVDKAVAPLAVDPTLERRLGQVYTETLSRTYTSSDGKKVMVSVAYGRDQRGEGRSHYPEVCYPAQGFQITEEKSGLINFGLNDDLRVARRVARQGSRVEPITYWVVVGDSAVINAAEHKRAIFLNGLQGNVPDGMLFRVSSIDHDIRSAYETQDRFIKDLRRIIGQDGKARLFGNRVAKS